MSVLISGMEMPKKCNECPLHFYEGQGICSCRALPAIEDDEILKPWKNKRKDCPLVPVPLHGRLIDADAFCAKDNKDFEIAMDVVESMTTKLAIRKLHDQMQAVISEAPTIIPAEEGE